MQHDDKGKLWVERRICHIFTCSWGVTQEAVRHPDKLLHKGLLGVKRVTQSICRQQKQCQLLLVTHMLQFKVECQLAMTGSTDQHNSLERQYQRSSCKITEHQLADRQSQLRCKHVHITV